MDTTISVRLDEETLNELDALLEARRVQDHRLGLRSSRSNVIRALIRQAYALAQTTGTV